MSAIIPKRPPPRAPLKLTVNSSSTAPAASSTSTTSSSSSGNSINQITTTTTNESKRPSLKVSSVIPSLSSLSISIPKDQSSSHYSSSLNPPSSSSSSSSSSNSSSGEGGEDSHKWGKGDQARMAGEIKEIITRPVGLEEELSGGLLRVERRVRSNSRVGGSRPPVVVVASSESEREATDTKSAGGEAATTELGKEEVGHAKEEEQEEEEEGLLQAELDVSPATLVDLGRLGEGASGEVRKVRHTPTGIIMAKKVS